MEFTVSKNALLSKMLIAGKVVNTKTNLPILENFLCEVYKNLEGGDLKITASDTESSISFKVDIVMQENQNIDFDKFTLPAKLIIESLKSIPEQPITFEINSSSIRVKYNGGHFELVSQDPAEFPIMPKAEKAQNFEISSALLHEGIDSVKAFCEENELKPTLGGVFIKQENDSISFVATNATYLALYEYYLTEGLTKITCLLSKKIINILSNISSTDEFITFMISEKNIEVSVGGFEITSRQIEGNFPNYKNVIPTINTNIIKVSTSEIKDAIQRVSIFANQNSKLIVFNISPKELKITAQDIDFSISAEESVGCLESNIKSLKIGFRMDFILQAVSHIKTDECILEFSDETRAILVKPTAEEFLKLQYLVMPMLINS
ncbi:MAG: DNA polymerase III subunit beta [Paludibacteraceae bacterium]|nr:DNA polymerase III subunit beta [Paludibacteraceae bacterium]